MKTTHTVKALVLALTGAGLASLPHHAFATPTGGTVVAGNVTIRDESATKVGITQTTDKAIIDWQKYSIGANEHVQYYQPSANSVTLNRVVGQDPSQILGRLSANGQVFLVNPNGIYFGKNAQIDVAGLVATTHNIRNEDFLAGKYLFDIPGKPEASVINEGSIRIADTGIAAFVAPSVANRGIIVARLGKVTLAAANGFALDFTGDDLLSFMVGDEVAKTAYDLDGNPLSSFTDNAGRIEADGGRVLMTAKAAESAIHGVINHSGVIQATTVEQRAGEIILHAGKRALHVSGTLDASAPNGGDGGFIETSGGEVSIDPASTISTSSGFGSTGKWLIDPIDYIIAPSGGHMTGSQLASYLQSNHVEIQTDITGTGAGDIFVNDAVIWNNFNKLTLTAYRHVEVNAPITANGGGSVRLRADARGSGTGTVRFGNNGYVSATNGASVGIYYNPASYTDASTRSDAGFNPFQSKVFLNNGAKSTAYMLVNSVHKLQEMEVNLAGNYALGKNIDASETSTWNSGAGLRPIGNNTNRFMGRMNGLDNTIYNLSINRPTTNSVGLFGSTGPLSSITNIQLVNASITGRSSTGILVGEHRGGVITNSHTSGTVVGYSSVGGLAGYSGWIYDASITDTTVYVDRASSSANVTGQSNVGGLIGYFYFGSLKNSYATGSVKSNIGIAQTAGGLLGGLGSATVTNSYATGPVTGGNIAGGLVGISAEGAIYNSYAFGSVSSLGESGGLVGHANGSITDSFAIGSTSGVRYVGGLVGYNDSEISNAFSAGFISGGADVGGLVGFNNFATFPINSYWNEDTSGQSTSSGGTKMTNEQMKQKTSFPSFNFNTIWDIAEGSGYPYLRSQAATVQASLICPSAQCPLPASQPAPSEPIQQPLQPVQTDLCTTSPKSCGQQTSPLPPASTPPADETTTTPLPAPSPSQEDTTQSQSPSTGDNTGEATENTASGTTEIRSSDSEKPAAQDSESSGSLVSTILTGFSTAFEAMDTLQTMSSPSAQVALILEGMSDVFKSAATLLKRDPVDLAQKARETAISLVDGRVANFSDKSIADLTQAIENGYKLGGGIQNDLGDAMNTFALTTDAVQLAMDAKDVYKGVKELATAPTVISEFTADLRDHLVEDKKSLVAIMGTMAAIGKEVGQLTKTAAGGIDYALLETVIDDANSVMDTAKLMNVVKFAKDLEKAGKGLDTVQEFLSDAIVLMTSGLGASSMALIMDDPVSRSMFLQDYVVRARPGYIRPDTQVFKRVEDGKSWFGLGEMTYKLEKVSASEIYQFDGAGKLIHTQL